MGHSYVKGHIKQKSNLNYLRSLEKIFNANFCEKKRCVSLQVISEYSCWGFSVGYAISAKCFEEEESNKLPYFGSFSSVYSCAALVDLKIAQRQTFKK